MPQMMPLNWIFEYIFFLSVFINFMIINYYSVALKADSNSNKMIFTKSNNWLW